MYTQLTVPFFNEKYKETLPFLIVFKILFRWDHSVFTEYLIQTLLGSLHLEFRFHFSNVILGLKLQNTTCAGCRAPYFYYCTFVGWLLFYFLRCSFICIVLICVLVWSHLRMLSRITFIESFLFNGSDHNPNVFCCIVIQKACTYCKCMCEFCACVAQECTYSRVWVCMSLLRDVRETPRM